jgi:hypothetical protein
MFQNFFLHIVNVMDTPNTDSRRCLSVCRSLTSESLEARASSRQDNGRCYPAFRAAVFERPLSKLVGRPKAKRQTDLQRCESLKLYF